MHGGSRESEREYGDFRGAAEKRPDLRKPKMACQGAQLLPSGQWMSHWKTLDREMTVPSGFWCLELGFLSWGESLLPSTARSSPAEWLSGQLVKSESLDLDPRSDMCWLCGLSGEASPLWAVVSRSAIQD